MQCIVALWFTVDMYGVESVVLGCQCQALMAPPLKIDGSLLVHCIRPVSVKRADVEIDLG